MTLEARIQLIEDKQAIADLIFAYARVCDTGFNGAAMAQLFTPDAVWETNFGIRVTGHQEITDFFNAQVNTKFALHFYTNMVTEVAGDTATGRCLLVQTCTDEDAAGTAGGTFMGADYLNDFVRTEAGWKFAHVRLNQRFRVPAGTDWGPSSIDTPTVA